MSWQSSTGSNPRASRLPSILSTIPYSSRFFMTTTQVILTTIHDFGLIVLASVVFGFVFSFFVGVASNRF